jgi:hypothetical protein
MKNMCDSLQKTSEVSSSGIVAKARASLDEFAEARRKAADSLDSTSSSLIFFQNKSYTICGVINTVDNR